MNLLQVERGPLTNFRSLPVNQMFTCSGYPDRVYTKVSDRKYYSPTEGRSKMDDLGILVYPIVLVTGQINRVA